jgi:predicted HTH transcriptional regulator
MKLISDNLGKNVCQYIRPVFHTIDESEVCKVEIKASPRPVFAGKEAIFYVRTGNQTQKLNPREAVEYIRYHWDNP